MIYVKFLIFGFLRLFLLEIINNELRNELYENNYFVGYINVNILDWCL